MLVGALDTWPAIVEIRGVEGGGRSEKLLEITRLAKEEKRRERRVRGQKEATRE